MLTARPTAAVHLRHVVAACHGRLGAGLDAIRHLSARHVVRRRGRYVRTARRRVDRRMRASADGGHIARQPNPATGETAVGEMQIGVFAMMQFLIVLFERLFDQALILRQVTTFAVVPPFEMMPLAGAAAVRIHFTRHFGAGVFHPAAVTAVFFVNQVLVFRPVHVFRLGIMSESAVRRMDRRAVVVVVTDHAVRVMNGMPTMLVMLDHAPVRLTLGVHDMVPVRMMLAVHFMAAVDFTAFGVVIHDLVAFGRSIGMTIVVPNRRGWRGAMEPKLAMLGTKLVVEEIAFDVLDCHVRGSYRFPMSGYLR